MKLFHLHTEGHSYLEQLAKWKRAREYLFEAQKILRYGLRDMAVLCGYEGEAEFQAFIRRFTVGHRLLTKSPKFSRCKTAIDNEIKRKYNEMVEEDVELVRREENRNRDCGTDCS